MTLRERENVVQISEEFGLKSSRLKTEQSRNFSWGVLESLWIGFGRYPNIPSNSHVLDGRKVGRASERLSAGSGADNHKNKL
jgi:hypothetical protein